jgi:hypothetical protein
MKTILQPQDFELRSLKDTNYQYFSYDAGTFELTIEPTDAGYLVCVYDHDGILEGRRKPVLFKRYSGTQDCFAAAVRLASDINITKIYGYGALGAQLIALRSR